MEVAAAHTPYLTSLTVGVGENAARGKTGFYKAVLFVPKYLMNMLLK